MEWNTEIRSMACHEPTDHQTKNLMKILTSKLRSTAGLVNFVRRGVA
jgi:hypothetical protein